MVASRTKPLVDDLCCKTSILGLLVLQILSPSPASNTAQECWFFMRQGKKFERKDETKEGMELSAKADVDANLLAAITDEDSSILKAGLLPKLEAATPAGSKALLEGMQQAS